MSDKRIVPVTSDEYYKNNLPNLLELFKCHNLPWKYDEKWDVVWNSTGQAVVNRTGVALGRAIAELGNVELRKRAESEGIRFREFFRG